MECFTFYKGVFTPEQLGDYLTANGDITECEMFKVKQEGDDERIKNVGFIAKETCDEEIWKELPTTLREALGELPMLHHHNEVKDLTQLVIKIYESCDCGFKYDIFDKDDARVKSIDGGHCSSDMVNALKMATNQAMFIALKNKNDKHAMNLKKFYTLSENEQEEVKQIIKNQKADDEERKENGDSYWEGTDEQHFDWALKEFN